MGLLVLGGAGDVRCRGGGPKTLRYLMFLGSVRDSTPPRPARIGERVARACLSHLTAHDATLVDPLDFEFPRVFKPHFSYAAGKAPPKMEELARRIEAADGYVMISPEYNHSMSPALADLLNHFGSSLFAYKPSAIITYSAGQWGGTRAAAALRPFLSELGCIPVSAMVHIPKAHEAFDEAGQPLDAATEGRWSSYFGRSFDQLTWWAEAARRQREAGSQARPEAFLKSPQDRNAP